MKEGDYEKSLASLREAFVHHSGDAGIKLKMAICHLKLGEKKLAVKLLEEALEANSALESEFAYFFPEGEREPEIEGIIKQYKK